MNSMPIHTYMYTFIITLLRPCLATLSRVVITAGRILCRVIHICRTTLSLREGEFSSSQIDFKPAVLTTLA